jgi:hypothetical protein
MPDAPPPAPLSPEAGSGGLRAVTVLVMLGSILGLLGSGFCALAFISDSPSDGGIALLLATPPLLFFAATIWICKALLDRLRK